MYLELSMQDIEICVPAGRFSQATQVFARHDTGLQKLRPPKTDLFTQYKQHCPRFRDHSFADLDIILLKDDDYGFVLNHTALMTPVASSLYSKEILNVLAAEDIADLPFPTLERLFSGICQRYKASGEAFFGIASEQLVDGMDIVEDDCRDCLAKASQEVREYAIQLARTKRDRIDYFSDNTITCYPVSEARDKVRDVDCIAKVDKEQLINILDGRSGFAFVNQTRQDHGAFLWSDTPDRKNAVVLEVFVFRGSAQWSSSIRFMSLRRYPELNNTFIRLGLDLQRAEEAAQSDSIDKLPAPQPGDVQKGLLRTPSYGT
ncbi:hypothetical protein DV738_g2246, partial [Chaetothyriales sp. CBS 135597]